METKTFTVAEVMQMVGMVIPRMKVKIAKVFNRRVGEGQYGPYSFQDGEIEDSTGSMKITFTNLPEQFRRAGKVVIIKSMTTNKGLKGAEVKAKDYKGKTTIGLVVHATAWIGEEDTEANTTEVTPSTRMPMTATEAEKNEKLMTNDNRKTDIATAKNRLTQLAGLYDLCWKTVEGMDVSKELGTEDIELKKDIATTLFIQSSREGLADKMVIRTTSKFYNEEAIKPAIRGEEVQEDQDIPF